MAEGTKHSLREWRRLKEMSQDDLAAAVGVSRTTIFNWEDHPEKMTVDKVERVARALDLSINDIIFLPEHQQNVEGATT